MLKIDSQPALRGAYTTSTPVSSSSGQERTGVKLRERLVSLDAFRGFTMFWIVGGASLFRGIGALGDGIVFTTMAEQVEHSSWQGLRYYDIIWPSFMLMVGVAVALSHASRSLQQSRRQELMHAFRRAAILFLLGSLRTSVSSGEATLIELSSALQPIGVAYLVAVWLAVYSWRVQAAVAAGILIFYGLGLHLVGVSGVPAGSYELNHNLVTWVDEAILGRSHPEGWGTLLSTIPTISTTLLGLVMGALLLSELSRQRKALIIGLTGVGCILMALLLSPWIPVIMKLWTTSYGLMTAGWSCLLFLPFFWIIDFLGYRRWSFFFVVIGMNAIFSYMVTSLFSFRRIAVPFAQALAGGHEAFAAFSAGLTVTLVWSVLYWMYRRKIFIKI